MVPGHDSLLHFVPRDQRLRPGTPIICAHCSVPGDPTERAQRFTRFAGFAAASGIAADMAHSNAHSNAPHIAAQLPILTPAGDESLLRQAGFHNVQLFHTGLTFRGWICTAEVGNLSLRLIYLITN